MALNNSRERSKTALRFVRLIDACESHGLSMELERVYLDGPDGPASYRIMVGQQAFSDEKGVSDPYPTVLEAIEAGLKIARLIVVGE